MIVDSYFEIGSSHEVCQDYTSESLSAVAISDGCSSNAHSDLGSRILAKNAISQISSNNKIIDPKGLIIKSKFIADNLDLSQFDLNATLLTISASNPKSCKVQVFGDGVIVARERNSQDLYVIDISYESGAPFYLQYLLDDKLVEGWKEKYGPQYTYKTSYVRKDGTIEPISEMKLDTFKNELGFEEEFKYKDWDLVTVLSDGIHSFQEKEVSLIGGKEPINYLNYLDVIQELFKFKLTNGVFIKRRCNKFFNKHCKSNNWSHYDDFSMGGIYLPEVEDVE